MNYINWSYFLPIVCQWIAILIFAVITAIIINLAVRRRRRERNYQDWANEETKWIEENVSKKDREMFNELFHFMGKVFKGKDYKNITIVHRKRRE